MTLPTYASPELVAARLPLIFPVGTPNRTYCIRDLAASTVFAALYIGAVEGESQYLGPIHVYRMTDEQSVRVEDESRRDYAKTVLKKKALEGTRWYADNTREPIRDETLRDGLVAVGAILARTDLPTTSAAPRYALKGDFAKLFNPALIDDDLQRSINEFQSTHLSKSALARVSIIRAGAAGNATAVGVKFPSGETRQLAPGPSSIIAKAVIEVFCPKYLKSHAVLWLSESGNKVVVQDNKLANAIGLKIEADKNLPDLILADLGPKEPLIIFVEVVATDGAVTDRRQTAMLALTDAAGFQRSQVLFVTAYQDRASPGFKKTVSQLAWGTFAWFVSEPDGVLNMRPIDADADSLAELARK